LFDYVLVIAIVAAAALGVAVLFGFGIHTSVAGVRISSRTLLRPTIVFAFFALILLYRTHEREWTLTALSDTARRRAIAIAAVLSLLVLGVALRFSPFEASAADQYGYISQAQLWLRGDLITPQPLAAVAPWPDPEWTLSPLGYRPGPQPATIVPTYSPGLPLTMAAVSTIVGPFGAFMAVPLLGGAAIFTTFILGKRFAGSMCGLMSAALLMTSPIFLFQLKEPMSDVPVTTWWLLSMTLAAGSTPLTAFGAGLAGAAAILTRPNLAPLAAVLGMFVLSYSAAGLRTRFRNAFLFALPIVPGCIAVGLLNRFLYGSPFASGYGSVPALFGTAYFWPNLTRYAQWLFESETAFILLAPVGLFFAFRTSADPRVETDPPRMSRPLAYLFTGFCGTLYACYAFYLPFDNWTFLRFLLPAIPVLLILCSAAVVHFGARLTSPMTKSIVAAMFLLLVAWRWDATGLKPRSEMDRRYAVIGEYVRDELPPNAIVVSLLHSGSVRYYSGRQTLRWDWLAPEWLEPALSFLRANGYHPFLLIEEWDRAQFVERFTPSTKLGTLDWPPVASYQGDVRVDIFDPADRPRVASGEDISTRFIARPGR
jgi:hypothetical protein